MVKGSLQGKVAIVTGAGSPIGIGHAIALGLVRAGARVALLDVNKEWLDESVNEVRELGGDEVAVPIVADVTDAEAVERAVGTTISELGGVHILFNSAGIYPRWPGFAPQGTNFWDHTPEAWSRGVAVNLSGPFLIARAVVGHLRAQRWGRIIGVTTSLGTMRLKGGSPYGPAKAGHEALVAIMAQELEGTGVTANVLVPGGATYSNITAARFARADLIQPEVMAAPAVWLASDASSNVNGRASSPSTGMKTCPSKSDSGRRALRRRGPNWASRQFSLMGRRIGAHRKILRNLIRPVLHGQGLRDLSLTSNTPTG